jgi:hypothetical protein
MGRFVAQFLTLGGAIQTDVVQNKHLPNEKGQAMTENPQPSDEAILRRLNAHPHLKSLDGRAESPAENTARRRAPANTPSLKAPTATSSNNA